MIIYILYVESIIYLSSGYLYFIIVNSSGTLVKIVCALTIDNYYFIKLIFLPLY